MTPKERAAMQAAWVWMDWYASNNGTLEPVDLNETITALREALAEQAEQEPVAWHEPGAYSNVTVYKNWANENGWIPLYTRPVRTKDLTDDEIDEIGKSYFDEWSFGFARAVIAADREKNK